MASISCLYLFIVYFHMKECNSFLLQQLYSKGRHHGSLPRQPIFIDYEQRSVHPNYPPPSSTSSLVPASSKTDTISTTCLFMGDHSCATLFQIGDTVTVIGDVLKAGKNLKGRTGTVIETWEKCDVDPTCCCAEWVDEGLSVHVKFNVNNEDENVLFANDTFIHYFAESELIRKKEDMGKDSNEDKQTPVAFDGLSCKAFKLDKLSMGEQAKRIAAFEESRDKM